MGGEECQEVISFSRNNPILTKVFLRRESTKKGKIYFQNVGRGGGLSFFVINVLSKGLEPTDNSNM